MRTLCLLDFENLAATPHLTPAIAERVLTDFLRVAGPERTAEFVGASSHHNAAATWFVSRRMRHLTASGPSGADLALVDVLISERVDERFSHVVIGSGDGVFTSAAARLAGRGVTVTSVCWAASSSRSLRLAASRTLFLDELAQSAAVAA